MPTYEYMCDSCGHQFDAFQSMMDDPLKDCPACSTPALRRLISGGTGIIFRGSGFYVNDSRSKGGRSSSAAPKDTANTSSGGDASASTASTSPASESSSAKSSGESGGAGSSKGSTPTKQSA